MQLGGRPRLGRHQAQRHERLAHTAPHALPQRSVAANIANLSDDDAARRIRTRQATRLAARHERRLETTAAPRQQLLPPLVIRKRGAVRKERRRVHTRE